ncbi:siderophore ABC transporter substrate-binding protein [Alteribacter aurantiacus]|uniref:siderophore ABC transporter substrate-binding protein n=1 Tax=Alteribacter aurantiacus TaxID=254410 RepID=UPI00042082F0|nr:siderophore ABC transporter substrate-binding protein [Alteribacter aurantiacus]
MKKMWMTLLGATVVLAACGEGEEATSQTAEDMNGEGQEEVQEESKTEEAEELTITHEFGETVVPVDPERVVVFDLGVLDTLDHLGADIAAVPTANVPDYLEKYRGDEYETAGTLFEPDFETIYDIDPELIIISGRASEAYDELSEIAPTIFLGVDTENYMESFTENVTTLGEIFNKEEEAQAALSDIEGSLKELQDNVDAEGLLVMANEGDISAYGPGSRFGLLHDDFGIKPTDEGIETANHGQNVSYEYVVEQNPEYLFVIDRGAAIGEDASAKEAVENELIQTTDAYKNDRIVYLDPVKWYITTGGLTSVSDMVDEVKKGVGVK